MRMGCWVASRDRGEREREYKVGVGEADWR